MTIEEIAIAVRMADCKTTDPGTVEVFDCARERALMALEIMSEISGLRGSEAMSGEGVEYFTNVLENHPDGLRGALISMWIGCA